MYVLLNHSEKIRTRREVLEMQKALRPAYIIYWLQLHEELESHDNVGMSVIPGELEAPVRGLGIRLEKNRHLYKCIEGKNRVPLSCR